MDSQQCDLQLLAARVAKLEAANRRWKAASIVAALSACSFLLIGAKPADRIEPDVLHARSVEAQDFVLRDADGHVYARLGITPRMSGKTNSNRTYAFPNGGPLADQATLQFYDDKGDVLWTAPSAVQLLPVKP